MASEYDENLEENLFFQQLHANYGEILKTASENNWIICVPRVGSFSDLALEKSDVLEHILTSNANNQYQNLNHVDLEKLGDNLIFRSNNISRRVRVLFIEDFFTGNNKYTIWCIDELLNRTINTKCTELIEIHSFCDCINFLWTDTLGCKLLEEINSVTQMFLCQCTIEEFDIIQLKNLIQNMYDHCLFKALECFPDKLDNENFVQNLKVAVETFMYACIKEKLFNCLCTFTSTSDASLNKIIRNAQDIPLRALKISSEFYDILPIAKIELNKINNTFTVLNKVMCLKRTFKVLSSHVLTSEMLLEILIFLIIKSNVYNWVANLLFINKFRFSETNSSDETQFLITTLQAALKFLNDGGLSTLHYEIETESCENDFNTIVALIKEGNLDSIINMISYNDKLSKKLCHPLCSCDNCEFLLKTNTCQVDSRDEKGRSFLHIAAQTDHQDIVQFLMNKGANINVQDYSGLLPIHYAAASGNQQATFIFLHMGCDKNARDIEGNTPLHLATRNGQENCVKTLIYFTEDLGNDLDINCTNNAGDTPLHFAAKYAYVELVKLLIEYGGKIVFNNRSLSAYHVAHNDFIKSILKTVAILRKDFKSNLKLKQSIGDGKSDFEKKADVDSEKKSNLIGKTQDNYGVCPKSLEQFKKTDLLLKAVENNDLPLTCFYLGIPMPHNSSIIQSNCHPLCVCEKCKESAEEDVSFDNIKQETLNVNICNPDGYTPLHFAAKFGRYEILRLLLDIGALVNLKTYKTFYTPLHLSCIFRRKVILKELLKCGNCAIDPTDCYGNTPLHYVCSNNDLEILEILMSHGANSTVKNKNGKTCVDEAAENIFFDISRVLKERTTSNKFNTIIL